MKSEHEVIYRFKCDLCPASILVQDEPDGTKMPKKWRTKVTHTEHRNDWWSNRYPQVTTLERHYCNDCKRKVWPNQYKRKALDEQTAT